MPELPEVETIKKDLEKKVIGKTIQNTWTDHPKVAGNLSFPALTRALKGQKITALGRRAKNLLIGLSSGKTLWIHLKMTGHLLYKPLHLSKKQEKNFNEDRYNQYVHFALIFKDKSRLELSDLRKFARLRILNYPLADILEDPEKFGLGKLGPEPLTPAFTEKVLAEILKDKQKAIKLVLMDQALISGIGNIYASEILYAAGIDPRIPAAKLKPQRIKKLYQSIKKILQKAVKLRGTSTSDYRDTDGAKGNFGSVLQVYGRAGKTCSKCGKIIKRIKQGQRSTFYCPYCQK